MSKLTFRPLATARNVMLHDPFFSAAGCKGVADIGPKAKPRPIHGLNIRAIEISPLWASAAPSARCLRPSLRRQIRRRSAQIITFRVAAKGLNIIQALYSFISCFLFCRWATALTVDVMYHGAAYCKLHVTLDNRYSLSKMNSVLHLSHLLYHLLCRVL